MYREPAVKDGIDNGGSPNLRTSMRHLACRNQAPALQSFGYPRGAREVAFPEKGP
jgi:hypothetical protein